MGFSEKASKYHIALLVNEMCADRKFNDLSVADICAQAGISRATFYRLFCDKTAFNNWVQALNFSVGIHQIGRGYSWADGLFMAYSCAHFFGGIARASYDGQGRETVSFSHRCMRACLADTLEHVKGVPCTGRIAFQVDFFSGSVSQSSANYWKSSRCDGDVHAFAVELARCVPAELFAALDEPADPRPTFEVNAASLARAAQEMDETFLLGV